MGGRKAGSPEPGSPVATTLNADAVNEHGLSVAKLKPGDWPVRDPVGWARPWGSEQILGAAVVASKRQKQLAGKSYCNPLGCSIEL